MAPCIWLSYIGTEIAERGKPNVRGKRLRFRTHLIYQEEGPEDWPVVIHPMSSPHRLELLTPSLLPEPGSGEAGEDWLLEAAKISEEPCPLAPRAGNAWRKARQGKALELRMSKERSCLGRGVPDAEHYLRPIGKTKVVVPTNFPAPRNWK